LSTPRFPVRMKMRARGGGGEKKARESAARGKSCIQEDRCTSAGMSGERELFRLMLWCYTDFKKGISMCEWYERYFIASERGQTKQVESSS